MKSLYEELGVAREASAEQIKAAYRRRAFETHPDQGGDREVFQRVQQAYEILGDEAKRRRYDLLGDDGRTDIESPEQLAADCFRAMLRQGWHPGSDIVAHARAAMANGIEDHRSELRRWNGDVERLERYARRLRKRAGKATHGRLLEDAIEAEMETPRAKVAFHTIAVLRLSQALEILHGYEFGEGEVRIENAKPAKKPRTRRRKAAGDPLKGAVFPA